MSTQQHTQQTGGVIDDPVTAPENNTHANNHDREHVRTLVTHTCPSTNTTHTLIEHAPHEHCDSVWTAYEKHENTRSRETNSGKSLSFSPVEPDRDTLAALEHTVHERIRNQRQPNHASTLTPAVTRSTMNTRASNDHTGERVSASVDDVYDRMQEHAEKVVELVVQRWQEHARLTVAQCLVTGCENTIKWDGDALSVTARDTSDLYEHVTNDISRAHADDVRPVVKGVCDELALRMLPRNWVPPVSYYRVRVVFE